MGSKLLQNDNLNAGIISPLTYDAHEGGSRQPPRRNKRTPSIPPYDPPSETFTPPREVIIAPTISKSSKRKPKPKPQSTPHPRLRKFTVPISVKQEPPDIDLSTPALPTSPTDVPLLLTGPSNGHAIPGRRKSDQDARVEVQTLPPSSPMDDDDDDGFLQLDQPQWPQQEFSDITDIPTSMALEEQAQRPLFNLNPTSGLNDEWSDSEEEAFNQGSEMVEGIGEFTGRWRMMKVPTKADPPSPATRRRMEQWGRPISPFPGQTQRRRNNDSDFGPSSPTQSPGICQRRTPSRTRAIIHESSSHPNTPVDTSPQLISPLGPPSDSVAPFATPARAGSEQEQESPSLTPNSPVEELADAAEEEEVRRSVEPEFEEKAERPLKRSPLQTPSWSRALGSPAGDQPWYGSILPGPFQRWDVEAPTIEVEGASLNETEFSSGEASEDENGLIRITSTDPMAAARAAAILKQVGKPLWFTLFINFTFWSFE